MIVTFNRFAVLCAALMAVATPTLSSAANAPAYFQIENGVGTGPPFPTESVTVEVFSESYLGTSEAKILNTATAVSSGWSSQYSLVATSPALNFTTIYYDFLHTGAPGSIPSGGLLDVTYRVEIQDPPGTPTGDPPFVLVTGSDFVFGSSFEVEFAACNIGGHKAGGGGTGVGRVGGKMVAAPGGGVSLVDLIVSDVTVDPFFDITYRVSIFDPILLAQSGGNLLRMTMTAEILEVPEPATVGLAMLGLVGVMSSRRRRRHDDI